MSRREQRVREARFWELLGPGLTRQAACDVVGCIRVRGSGGSKLPEGRTRSSRPPRDQAGFRVWTSGCESRICALQVAVWGRSPLHWVGRRRRLAGNWPGTVHRVGRIVRTRRRNAAMHGPGGRDTGNGNCSRSLRMRSSALYGTGRRSRSGRALKSRRVMPSRHPARASAVGRLGGRASGQPERSHRVAPRERGPGACRPPARGGRGRPGRPEPAASGTTTRRVGRSASSEAMAAMPSRSIASAAVRAGVTPSRPSPRRAITAAPLLPNPNTACSGSAGY